MKKEKIIINNNGELCRFIWNVQYCLDNNYHRANDKPAIIEYCMDNKLWSIYYFQYNLCHLDYKPSYILFYTNGNIRHEGYYQNNQRHNDYGPSKIRYKNI